MDADVPCHERAVSLPLARALRPWPRFTNRFKRAAEGAGTPEVDGLAQASNTLYTWPFMRLISDDRSGHSVETLDGEIYTLSFTNAEPKDYLNAVQVRN